MGFPTSANFESKLAVRALMWSPNSGIPRSSCICLLLTYQGAPVARQRRLDCNSYMGSTRDALALTVHENKRFVLPPFWHSWFQTFAVFWMLYAFFWVIPRGLNFICRRFGTLCPPMKMEVFRNVGIQSSDPGELPRRKHTTFRTRRKFEIKKSISIFSFTFKHWEID